MPNKSLYRARAAAYTRQAGRCLYCGVLMWISDGAAFADRHGLPRGITRWLQCTAEHLQARSDGGLDAACNIAAACWLCNHRRHARKASLSPEHYQKLVRTRVSRGRWHPEQVHMRGLIRT